jgi:uncharacterized protein YcfJ
MSKNGQEILDETSALLNKDYKQELLTKTKGTVQGAFAGMVGGAMFGYFKGKNIYVTGFVGLLIGGLISSIMVGKLSKDDGETED